MKRILLAISLFLLIIPIIFLASFSQEIPYEEGNIEIIFCPNCTNFHSYFLEENKTRCAFYDLDPEIIGNIEDDDILVYAENHEGTGEKAYSRGYMHHKFCSSDSKILTGSTNPTVRGINNNYNNIVIIESRLLAHNYNDEWEELRKRGNKKTKLTRINLSGIIIENYFCPEDDCEERVADVLENAEQSIHFMTFSFTSERLGDILAAKSESIHIEGMMESFGLNKYSQFEKLKSAGIDIELERTGRMLHHKVFIIDNRTVITGSYNPTKSGTERNDENILIIHSKKAARMFLEEYERIYSNPNI